MHFMAVAAAVFLSSQPGVAEPPCRAHPNGTVLDFWLGDWSVTSLDGRSAFGENRVEADLAGCAIFESWKSAGGAEGRSLFAFDARSGEWEQLWVTSDTTRPGGIKRKRLVETGDGGVRFQGELRSADGAPYLDRTTLAPLPAGRVRQTIEISADGGRTWTVTFDALYSPKG